MPQCLPFLVASLRNRNSKSELVCCPGPYDHIDLPFLTSSLGYPREVADFPTGGYIDEGKFTAELLKLNYLRISTIIADLHRYEMIKFWAHFTSAVDCPRQPNAPLPETKMGGKWGSIKRERGGTGRK